MSEKKEEGKALQCGYRLGGRRAFQVEITLTSDLDSLAQEGPTRKRRRSFGPSRKEEAASSMPNKISLP